MFKSSDPVPTNMNTLVKVMMRSGTKPVPKSTDIFGKASGIVTCRFGRGSLSIGGFLRNPE